MAAHFISYPTTLKGDLIDLIPLEKAHFEALFPAAADKELWEFIPTDCSKKESFDAAYDLALEEREKGRQYPFVVLHKETNELIGSTRFFEIYPKDKKLEIGWSWIITKYWGKSINLECKLLLLTFCFEVLGIRRVQLKTDERNIRSRKAIEKIGGKFEGVLRKDRIKENGVSRNAAYYSILDDEWPGVKQKLIGKINEKVKK